ncbi:MAG: pyrimidine/purine nucleoside phosphorylase [Porticoccaceae bacterium]|nr:pyrimidine/purine nucleoside phosphorylase [Porticoccaceae bacterium]
MSEFTNVTVSKEANVYFDGQVTSRTIIFADGTRKTLGVMLPGDYEFGTEVKELMEITSGELDVLLPDSSEWQAFTGDMAFEVPANAKFGVKVRQVTNYVCSYFA